MKKVVIHSQSQFQWGFSSMALSALVLINFCGELCNAFGLNQTMQGVFKPMAIFDNDDRAEVFDGTELEKESAHGVLGRVSKEHLKSTTDGFLLQRSTLGKTKCEKNRFSEQMLGPTCSGFLIRPDVIVTAGHCMNEEIKCAENVWVFDLALKKPGDQSYKSIPYNKVYQCKKILARKQADFGKVDYALVQLDRPVMDRKPYELDFDFEVKLDSSIYGIGHPSGLPQKVAANGKVLNIDNSYSFDSDLDMFQGNSGSPIFDKLTGKIIGIASHGHEDYVRDGNSLNCKMPKICKTGGTCNPSTASRITNIQEDLKKVDIVLGEQKRELSQEIDKSLWPRKKGALIFKLKDGQEANTFSNVYKAQVQSFSDMNDTLVNLGGNIYEIDLNKTSSGYSTFSLSYNNNSNEDASEEAVAERMMESGLFEFVEPNYIYKPDMISSDPLVSKQWYIEKLGLPKVWDQSTGSSQIDVLVCDTGVFKAHPDIRNNIKNTGINVVDGSGQTEPTGNSHGTYVSGIIGAQGDNQIGMAGLNWKINIIPGKISNEASGKAQVSDMVKCIQWAVDNNVRVVNLSYNGGGSQAIVEVSKKLFEKNGILVLSMGNQGQQVDFTPNPYAIRVGASDSYDFPAYFSNQGESIDISAPGVSIMATDMNGDYKKVGGTSYSAPLVAGTAALLLSINPNLTSKELRSVILESAKDVGKPGYDTAFGYGLLDIAGAVELMKKRESEKILDK